MNRQVLLVASRSMATPVVVALMLVPFGSLGRQARVSGERHATTQGPRAGSPYTPADQSGSLDKTPPGEIDAGAKIWVRFFLDWTHCQVHRSGTYAPIEIILPGAISTIYGMVWNLSALEPQPGGSPKLYFVEDIFGMSGPAYGIDIPLVWEISVNGGPLMPITSLPDNSLTVAFPPGTHFFEVRISGDMQPFQGHGYYYLKMGQCILPIF